MPSISPRSRTSVRDRYGRTTFGQGALLARRLIEAGHAFRAGQLAVGGQRRSGNHGVGHARRQLRPAEESALPGTRPLALRADRRHGPARHVRRHAAGGDRRIRPQPAPGREHVGQHAMRPTAATTGRIATPRWWPAPASSAARMYGKSDDQGSSPVDRSGASHRPGGHHLLRARHQSDDGECSTISSSRASW